MSSTLRFSLIIIILLTVLAVRIPSEAAGGRVQNSSPEVTVTTPAVVQGQDVHYNGTGFTPSGSVDLLIESGYPSQWLTLAGTHANASGFIDGQFTAGSNIRPGTRQILFNDTSSLETAIASVLVLVLVHFSLNPTSFPGAVSGNISSVQCGGGLVGGRILPCGPSFDAAAISPNPSAGWRFDHWERTGNTTDVIPASGISCSPLNMSTTSCSGFSEGTLTAVFSAAITIFTDPTYVGSMSFGSCSDLKYTNGSVAYRPELPPEFTNLPICATPSYGFVFTGWTSTGGITVANHLSPATTIQLTGPGTLTAHYGVQISLQTGWNLISLPIVPSDTIIGSILKPLLDKKEVVSVWTYRGTPRVWSVYLPRKLIASTLSTMSDGNGYWIFMNSADKLNLTGTVIPPAQTPPTYPLVLGWNLIGFKPQPTIQNETVAQYLTSITGSYDQNNAWVYDNTSGSWIRATALTELAPGEAMWVLVTSTSGATLRP